jgi:hypothetical protein
MFRHGLPRLKPSKYPSLIKLAGGELLTTDMPQLEMQPKVSFFAVPGEPVLVSTQKSAVVPHWPHYMRIPVSQAL